MANMLDYVFWRGDLTFENVPFNEIDALILCQITYLNFDNIISRDFTEKAISLKDLNTVLSRSENLEKIKNVGAMINMDSWNLFTKAALSVRFGSLKAWGFVNKIDREKEEQFAAVTYTYSGDKKNKNNFNCIVFRGTDDTIVGWKEDFNLGYMETVPAQNDALYYVKEVCSKVKGPIKIAGHSKGGNLAIYSSAFSEEKIQKRIQDIYNNDGPGFSKSFFNSSGYLAIKEKIHSYFPQLSIIGMLFEHDSNYTTVESDEKGLYQHDPFSWHTRADGFEVEEDITKESRLIASTINGWINELDVKQREVFIEAVFGILQDSKAKTNTELTQNWFNSIKNMIKSLAQLDSKTKDTVSKTLGLLVKEAKKNFFTKNKEDELD